MKAYTLLSKKNEEKCVDRERQQQCELIKVAESTNQFVEAFLRGYLFKRIEVMVSTGDRVDQLGTGWINKVFVLVQIFK